MIDDVTGGAGVVDTARLMACIDVFAKRTKLAGTPDELASFREIEAWMRDIGFRTNLILHDAYISLPGSASVSVGGERFEAITHSHSAAGTVSGALIYVGEGRAADFAGRDVSGAIVLAEGIANPDVANRASRAGAAGQLHISPHEHLHEMCVSPVWGNPSATTRGELPSTVVATIAKSDGERLLSRLHAGEALAGEITVTVDTGWRKTPLLVADMDAPGGMEETPFILLSGHHDTWYFGVMDNGAANATMVEAARIAASHRANWRRGLRVCFWSGHSQGRYSGSAWYADTYWDELDRRCAAHVNIDSTGGIGATVLTASGVASELAALAVSAVAAESGQTHAGKRQGRAADMSFWGIGIPAMFGSVSHQPPSPVKMRNALGWWWHTPHDTADKIDPAFLTRDTRIVVRALMALLTSPVLPLRPETQVASLIAELAAIPQTTELALTDLLAVARALERTAAAVPREVNDPARVDAALMRVSRALVPLDYTAGDRFSHDPALPQPPWPALQPIRAFAAAPEDEQRMFLRVDAVRACNRVRHAIRTAQEALAAV